MTKPILPLRDANTIPLSQGKYAVVDSDVWKELLKYKWYLSNGYASKGQYLGKIAGKKIKKEISMHRFIIELTGKIPDRMVVDHINGCKLDNRRRNLRICTQGQNCKNSDKALNKKSSKYKGVSWDKRSRVWSAVIMSNAKNFYIGSFKDEIAAAIAYNEAALEHFGEFARLNVFTSTAP